MLRDRDSELHVAVGVLVDPVRGVLIQQRAQHSHMGGAWEFPGGKLLKSETPLQGLVRELREELAIEVEYARFLLTHRHQYPDRLVYLYIWKVLRWRGAPQGVENQPLQWLQPAGLMQAGLLPADQAIVAMLETSAPVNTLAWDVLATSVSV